MVNPHLQKNIYIKRESKQSRFHQKKIQTKVNEVLARVLSCVNFGF
jgi:hypothetical protein